MQSRSVLYFEYRKKSRFKYKEIVTLFIIVILLFISILLETDENPTLLSNEDENSSDIHHDIPNNSTKDDIMNTEGNKVVPIELYGSDDENTVYIEEDTRETITLDTEPTITLYETFVETIKVLKENLAK